MIKHMTGSFYVVAKVDGEVKVLLHKHKKYGIWLQLGGHVEPEENPLEAAYREAKEEAGIDVLMFPQNKELVKNEYVTELPSPFTILEEPIPATEKEEAHYHIDCIYFGYIQNPAEVTMAEECNWFSKKDLDGVELQGEVGYLGREAIKVGERYL